MFDAVILAAGGSMRMGKDKLSLDLGGDSVLSRAIKPFKSCPKLQNIILAVKKEHFSLYSDFSNGIILAEGGKTRTESVKSALRFVTAPYVLIHDGARPFVTAELIENVYDTAVKYGSGIPALPFSDSVRRIENGFIRECPDRGGFCAVQTPQGFDSMKIKAAYSKLSENDAFTDDSEVYQKYCSAPAVVEGDPMNKKLTSPADILGISAKVGTGFDVHPLAENRKLVLCGVEIPFEKGLLGHSDADAAIHAVMDALLSAAGLPDIGVLFPDSYESLKGVSSLSLLALVTEAVRKKNLKIHSVSLTVIAEKPKLSPYRQRFAETLSAALQIPEENIGIGFTTTEKLGIIGEGRAIAASSIVSLV